MQIKFRDLVEIETFAQLAEQFDGGVDLWCGSYIVDGESVVGILTIGMNKWIDLKFTGDDVTKNNEFKKSVKQMGIKTKGE